MCNLNTAQVSQYATPLCLFVIMLEIVPIMPVLCWDSSNTRRYAGILASLVHYQLRALLAQRHFVRSVVGNSFGSAIEILDAWSSILLQKDFYPRFCHQPIDVVKACTTYTQIAIRFPSVKYVRSNHDCSGFNWHNWHIIIHTLRIGGYPLVVIIIASCHHAGADLVNMGRGVGVGVARVVESKVQINPYYVSATNMRCIVQKYKTRTTKTNCYTYIQNLKNVYSYCNSNRTQLLVLESYRISSILAMSATQTS